MIRKITLTFVAVAAMSLFAVSSTKAAQIHATSPGPVSVFGQQITQLVLSSDSGTVKCKSVTFEGTIPSSGGQQTTAEETTLTPTITECTAFGQAAVIDVNGCKLTITGNNGDHTTPETTYVDITGCTTGKGIEVTPQLNCTLTIPEQHGLSHVVHTTNTGVSPEDLEVNITLTGITYEPHGECPGVNHDTTLTHNGQLNGQATFRAREDTGSEQVTHNGHQYQKLLQTGTLVGLLGT